MFLYFPEQVFLDHRFRYLQRVAVFFFSQLQETPHRTFVVLNGAGTISLYYHFPLKLIQQIGYFHRFRFYGTFVYAKIRNNHNKT